MATAINRILWWALLLPLGLYVAVVHLATLPANPRVPLETVLPAFVALAVAIALGTLVIRRRMLVGPIQRGEIDFSTQAGVGRVIQPFIMNLALCEAIGILGFVLSFLSGRPIYSIAFAVAAAGLMWVHRPTAPDLNPPSAAQLGGRPPPIG